MSLWLLRSFLAAILFCCVTVPSSAQRRYYDVWHLRDSLALDFRSGAPVPMKFRTPSTWATASICDPNTGVPLLYTGGTTLWNTSHTAIRNSEGILSYTSETRATERGGKQRTLIVPHPGDESLYYLFALHDSTDEGGPAQHASGLYYSIIDVDGNGAVVEKNVLLLRLPVTNLAGVVYNCADSEYWIITHAQQGAEYFAWHLTPDGLASQPVISVAGSTYDIGTQEHYNLGAFEVSPDGTMLYTALSLGDRFNDWTGELLRFDPMTGRVGPVITMLQGGHAASFSPNSRFLYVLNECGNTDPDTLVQYAVDPQMDSLQIHGSTALVNAPHNGLNHDYYDMQLGPDGRIYVLKYGYTRPPLQQIQVLAIRNPDSPTAVIDGVPLPFSFPGKYTGNGNFPNCSVRHVFESISFPNCIEGFLGKSFAYETIDTVKMTVTGDTVICVGDSTKLTAEGADLYRWRPTAGLSCSDCPDPIASPNATTTYTIVSVGDGECRMPDTLQVTVKVVPFIQVDAGVDVEICRGESVGLKATGGEEFRWSPADGLSCTDCPDPIASPNATTVYEVRSAAGGDCSSVDSVTVTVHESPAADVTSDTALCPGGAVQLAARGGTTYIWQPDPTLSCEACPDPVARPQTTTTYRVQVINENGCAAFDSVRVEIHPIPVVDAGGDVVVCADNNAVELKAGGADFYRWDFSSDLSCLDCPDPIARPASTTTYYITGISAQGCEARDSVQVVVHPNAVVSAGDDRSICLGEETRLQADGSVRWNWEPADGLSCTDCSDPIARPNRTTRYLLTGWNAEGCEGKDTIEVFVRTEREFVTAWISRDLRGQNDGTLSIPIQVLLGNGPTDIAELEVTLEYDATVMVIDPGSIARLLSGTLLADWIAVTTGSTPGRLLVQLTAPPGKALRANGILLEVEGRMYLSKTLGTDLLLKVTTSSRCFDFAAESGYATVDSICGMNFRLIEAYGAKYVAPIVWPNPARERVQFEFGLGLDGPTQLEVFDIMGNRIGMLIDEVLAAGRYGVEWNVSKIPSGTYWYRLQSGTWSEGGEVRIEQ